MDAIRSWIVENPWCAVITAFLIGWLWFGNGQTECKYKESKPENPHEHVPRFCQSPSEKHRQQQGRRRSSVVRGADLDDG